MDSPPVNVARFDDLGAPMLYASLPLRGRVFAVEHECAFGNPNGRDIDPDTLALWIGEAHRLGALPRLHPQ